MYQNAYHHGTLQIACLKHQVALCHLCAMRLQALGNQLYHNLEPTDLQFLQSNRLLSSVLSLYLIDVKKTEFLIRLYKKEFGTHAYISYFILRRLTLQANG